MERIFAIDSHTGGEPTRVVIEGAPVLTEGDMAQRRLQFSRDHDSFRTAVMMEPRCSDVVVGALLCPPVDPSCTSGLLFFNNVGALGMCVHGTIGVVRTLAHLGRMSPGEHRLETPVGIVTALLEPNGSVTVQNVPSYRYRADVSVEVNGYGTITGDIAWGGNWFFLVNDLSETLSLQNVERLGHLTKAIRRALNKEGITGENGSEVDHIELFGPPKAPGADSKNFVLCPGGAYDRSPCGTGTSAKIACLMASGKLRPGQKWHQESIVGSIFVGWGEPLGDRILPSIQGKAYITGETTLFFEKEDPFRLGIRG